MKLLHFNVFQFIPNFMVFTFPFSAMNSPILFSKSFIIFVSIFRFPTYLKLIWRTGVGGSQLQFFSTYISIVPVPLLRDITLCWSHACPRLSLSEHTEHHFCWMWGSSNGELRLGSAHQPTTVLELQCGLRLALFFCHKCHSGVVWGLSLPIHSFIFSLSLLPSLSPSLPPSLVPHSSWESVPRSILHF